MDRRAETPSLESDSGTLAAALFDRGFEYRTSTEGVRLARFNVIRHAEISQVNGQRGVSAPAYDIPV
jgi:hypothetical protein